MAEEKKNSTLAQEKADDKGAIEGEKLSKDELDAVTGGASPYSFGIGIDKDKNKSNQNYPGIVAT
ncbi:MAG: hypothetical protein IKT98_10345 [Selenomonadaceae bacterium]|nr:hypothetical protein [Selenomonadaceae bacterium]